MGRFYLARYVGSGAETDPFRPSGADDIAGWSAIDLRPDPTVISGWALLWTPSALGNSPNRVTLTDNPDEVSATVRGRLESRLGVTLDDAPFRRLITQLLLLGDDAMPTRWNRLRPTLAGRYEVWLGGLLDTLPVVAGGSVATESFNKADALTLGPDLTWTEVLGDMSVVSNGVQVPTAAVTSAARAEADVATANHYAQVVSAVTGAPSSSNSNTGVYARFQPAAHSGYRLARSITSTGLASATRVLQQVTAGTATNLAGPTTAAISGTETLRVEASGSSISGLIGGVVVDGPVTDTTHGTGTRGGIYLRAGTAATRGSTRLDSFEIGDLAAASKGFPFDSPRPRRVLMHNRRN